MTTTLLRFVAVAFTLSACGQTTQPALKAPPPMVVKGFGSDPGVHRLVMHDRSVWVTTDPIPTGGGPEILRLDEETNVRLRVTPDSSYSRGRWWAVAPFGGLLWFVSPDGADPPDGWDGPATKDIQTVYIEGRPGKRDLNTTSVTGRLLAIDPDTGKIVHDLLFADWAPTGIAAAGGYLWATFGDVLAKMKDATLGFERVASPEAFELASGDGSLWLLGTNTLWRMDPASARVIATIELPSLNEIALSPFGLLATSKDKVTLLDLKTNKVVRSVSLSEPWGVVADEAHVYVSGFRQHRLTRLSRSLDLVDFVDLGSPNGRLPVSTDVVLAGQEAWVLNGDQIVRVTIR